MHLSSNCFPSVLLPKFCFPSADILGCSSIHPPSCFGWLFTPSASCSLWWVTSTGCCNYCGLVTTTTMTSSSGTSTTCLVYIVGAEVRPRSDRVYVANYKHIIKSSELIDSSITPSSLPRMHCVGVAQIGIGTLCEGLSTIWSPAEYVWWMCMGFTDDAISFQVKECWKCTPVPSCCDSFNRLCVCMCVCVCCVPVVQQGAL